MSVLNKIAFFSDRRDEVPNQQLARELAQTGNPAEIKEIAENLWNKEPNIQSDCLKVLYELGYLDPVLIAGYAAGFLKLLKHPNNRLVWGGMIGLSTIAGLKADELFPHYKEIIAAMEKGSVITKDNGVKTLALVASATLEYNRVIFPYLLQHLATCRPKEVPQHAEKTLPAVNVENKAEFITVLEKRMIDLSASEQSRIKKVLKIAQLKEEN
jgi:hypothetical protein